VSTQESHLIDAPSIERTRWRIDPARSRVEFRTPTLWGLATVKGHFERCDGTLDLQATPSITLTIGAASIDTQNKLRDKHLRSADFFDVENHPEVRFVSDSATLDGERLKVRGRLDAAGKSMPLELEATVRRVGDELEIDASTDADHHELGMTHSTLGMIKTPSHLMVHGRLVPDARREES
jgi:polyisoprenoid-binding protein YceI